MTEVCLLGIIQSRSLSSIYRLNREGLKVKVEYISRKFSASSWSSGVSLVARQPSAQPLSLRRIVDPALTLVLQPCTCRALFVELPTSRSPRTTTPKPTSSFL